MNGQTIPSENNRVQSIDVLRGIVMMLMALDHVRDFIHVQAFTQDPLNLDTTTPLLFLTRWITHYCAPIFVFLAGTSVYLQSLRKSKKDLSIFLMKRGLWLILIEVTVMSLAFTFDPAYPVFILQTIWAIGISMVLLGVAIWLPFRAILSIGLIIVFGHNLLDFYEASHKGDFHVGYSLVHRFGFYPLWDNHTLLVFYPFLAWTGLMLIGYCFGRLFTSYEGRKRTKILVFLGVGIIVFFIVLRYTNAYGDAQHWSNQKNTLYTIFSFVNTVKYPPSLLFMCMTIGPGILFLAWFKNVKSVLARIARIYGRVPFLYYILHFYFVHLICMALFFARGHTLAERSSKNADLPFNFVIPGEGYSLGIVYVIWILLLVALYPICKWFSDYKMKHKNWWLSYL